MVHCPCLIISFTMVSLPRYTGFFKTCTNSVVLICIFSKSCTTIKKLYNQRKKLSIFGTLSLALYFNDNGVCTKMYSFFQTCTNPVVLICIFSKSCTTIKKLYNQKKSCTSFLHCPWVLSSMRMVLAPKCTVLSKPVQILWSSYVYFQKAVQPLKSCTTKENSCTFLVHCHWLLISMTMVFVPKCTVFSKPVQILWSSYVYFQKGVQPLKSCTTKEKRCTFLVHCHWLLISLRMMFVQKCTVFSKAVQILWSSYVYF